MSITSKQQLLSLLEKQRLGTCNSVEEEMLQHWFDQVTVIEELTFASEEEKETIREDISLGIMSRIRIPAPAIARKPLIKRLWPLGIAAALVLCVSLFSVYFLGRNSATTPTIAQVTIEAPVGVEKLPVTLPDGSVVWLSGGSTLKYPEQFETGGRTVELNGVAFFSVKPDKNAPFTVNTPKAISIKVLGTSFVVDVRAKANHIKVSVLTGRVQIEEDKNKLSILTPGERISYSCLDKSFIKDNYRADDVSEWKNNGIIYLNNATVGELAVVLRTMYHTELSFDQKGTAQYRFNMSFSKDLSVDEVLEMLRTMSGVEFDRKDNEVMMNSK